MALGLLDGLQWLHLQLAGSMGATCHPQRAFAYTFASSTTFACTTFPCICIRVDVFCPRLLSLLLSLLLI
jgi:hypothetical protein